MAIKKEVKSEPKVIVHDRPRPDGATCTVCGNRTIEKVCPVDGHAMP